MAKYGNVTYGGTTYGETRKLAYSVEPLEIVVLSFSTAYVTWYSPTGTFSRIRLVRNQIGFAETAEDGDHDSSCEEGGGGDGSKAAKRRRVGRGTPRSAASRPPQPKGVVAKPLLETTVQVLVHQVWQHGGRDISSGSGLRRCCCRQSRGLQGLKDH